MNCSSINRGARSWARKTRSSIARCRLKFARNAAAKVAGEGLRWICGADAVPADAVPELERALRLEAIHRAEAGLLADSNAIADALYGRAQA